ncbi:MAG: hypothetical protein GY850_11375 [bacterium]|nr:hypothetical protein [bacterium]
MDWIWSFSVRAVFLPGTANSEYPSATTATDVKAGEGVTALLMFANVFLILCAYYFIKPLREGWIAVSDINGLSKMEVKAYSSFGQSLVLIPVVWFFGRLSTRYHRSALITRSTVFCMLNMAVFWAIQPGLILENLPYTGIEFYLWVGMFGVFVVAQFWAFAADIYTEERGRRMFPLNTSGENLLFRVVQEFLSEQALQERISDSKKLVAFTRDRTTAFYGDFYFRVNIMALLLQAFVASRLIKYGGFGAILLMTPVVALVSYTAMAFIQSLAEAWHADNYLGGIY